MKFDPLNDGISSVELLYHMGDDLMVVNAARVSMAKESEWMADPLCSDDGPFITLSPKDKKLVGYLAKHKHWTPFSHPQVQLRIKMPIFVARQWFKHMIGFTRNEVSRRYVDDTPEFFCPDRGEWRLRAANVKQGSSEDLFPGTPYSMQGSRFTPRGVMGICVEMYEAMIAQGICPEQARMVLPQSMYTEFIETGSLAAYARLAGLRLDSHAQKEIRDYAQAVDSIMSQLFPVSWEALNGGAQ